MVAKNIDVSTPVPSKSRAPAAPEKGFTTEKSAHPGQLFAPTFAGAPGRPVDYDALLSLQRTVGNREAQRFIQRQAAPPPGPTTTAAAGAAPAKKPPPTEAQVIADDAWVNSTVDGFPSSQLRSQIGGTLPKRRTFLRGMRRYLGSFANVVAHFKQIRPLRGVSFGEDIHMHEKAASRLEAVNQQLGRRLPHTDVALGLRGDFAPKEKTHKYETVGRTMHAFGFGIDFRATSNPQLHSLGLRTLIKLVTGESSLSMNLGLDESTRRALIRKVGAAPRGKDGAPELSEADKAQWDQLLVRLENEHTRLATASRKLTTEQPISVLTLRDLRAGKGLIASKLGAAQGKLESLKKKKKGVDPADVQKQMTTVHDLEAEQAQNLKDIAATEADLPALFADWLATIQEKMTELEGKAARIDKRLSLTSPNFKNDYQARMEGASKALARAKTDLTKTKATKQALDARRALGITTRSKLESKLKSVRGNIEAETAKEKANQGALGGLRKTEGALVGNLKAEETKGAETDVALKQAEINIHDLSEVIDAQNQILVNIKEIISIAVEWGPLEQLRRDLGDKKFVFRGNNTAEDPAALQILEKGFFTPDEAPAAGAAFDPHAHGYDLAFMKSMIEHGFDLGIAFGEGSADPMHFELVEGRDGLLDANRSDADVLTAPASVALTPTPAPAAATGAALGSAALGPTTINRAPDASS